LLARDGAGSEDDGYLRPAEIFRMKLNRTRLVVLSGCQTGVEKTSRGEGAISIARPFLAAGVPVVVASLWSVETDATKDLMIAFHNYRKAGRTTVEALRQAQLDTLDHSIAGDACSFTWASFVMIGGWSEF
jgi:CHAT domain-containing protein